MSRSLASIAVIFTLVGLGGFVRASAETVPPRGAVDPRVRVVAYNAEDVVKLRGYVGYQIHMQWAPGEEFVNLGAGDAGGFDIGAEKNHFFIKPKQERVNTNLTVLTTHRTYHFDYTVSKAPPNPGAAANLVYSIRFVYPHDDAKAATARFERQRTEARLTQSAAQRPKNTDYWYCGATSLKPLSAHDDGVQTRLRFPTRAEFPAIFVRNDDHSESLLNFNVEQDEVVIHRVARRLVLRRGQLVGCVVNQAFEGGAERPASNTTAPGVYRETRGANP
jgi:type IV secretion system protein VirB9